MSGNQPFTQDTFIITTPDSVHVLPGLNIRAVAILMYELRASDESAGDAALYVKHSGSTHPLKCYYQHQAGTDTKGRVIHFARFQEEAGLGQHTAVTWYGDTNSKPAPIEHVVTVEPAAKMDTPTGLFSAKCSCGEYQSAPSSQSHAQAAGYQHAAAKNAQETPTP